MRTPIPTTKANSPTIRLIKKLRIPEIWLTITHENIHKNQIAMLITAAAALNNNDCIA